MLSGIASDQATATFAGEGLQPPDLILILSDLSMAAALKSLEYASQSQTACPSLLVVPAN